MRSHCFNKVVANLDHLATLSLEIAGPEASIEVVEDEVPVGRSVAVDNLYRHEKDGML